MCSILPSPAWPHPVYLDSCTYHSRFLCNIVLYSIGVYFHHQTRPQLSVVSALAQLLHFFLELLVIAFHSFPNSILDTFQPGELIPRVISFCLFILFIGFSQQEWLNGFPFPPPLDHILSKLFTMIHPSWVALHSMAHRFSELYMPLCHDKAVNYEGVYDR